MRRVSNKPEVTKAAVMVKAMSGESKAKIARDLSMSRDTVRRILTEAQLSDLVLEGKCGVFSLIPKAVKAFDRALDKGKTAEAEVILRGTGVLQRDDAPSISVTNTVGIALRGMPGFDESAKDNQPIAETGTVP